MEIIEQAAGAVLIVRLVGRLDSHTAGTVEQVLPARVQTAAAVVVDLSEAPYVSSAGLRVLLKSAKGAKAAGSRLVLAGLLPEVREVFDISGFTSIFTLHATAEEAVAAVS